MSRYKGKQILTTVPKKGLAGYFSQQKHAKEPYNDSAGYLKQQPLGKRKLGFGTHDAKRRDEYCKHFQTEMYREQLKVRALYTWMQSMFLSILRVGMHSTAGYDSDCRSSRNSRSNVAPRDVGRCRTARTAFSRFLYQCKHPAVVAVLILCLLCLDAVHDSNNQLRRPKQNTCPRLPREVAKRTADAMRATPRRVLAPRALRHVGLAL